MLKNKPQQWIQNDNAAKATQVAFDLDEKLQYQIRKAAFEDGLSPSEKVRDILGLGILRKAKRPRLTVSLTPYDYEVLSKKYNLPITSQLEIKKRALDDLIAFIDVIKSK